MPVAGAALCCAIVSGGLLFIGRAAEDAAFDTFRIKLALIVCAVGMTLLVRRRYGIRLGRATDRQCVTVGLASIALWVGVAVSGRMIAFIHD